MGLFDKVKGMIPDDKDALKDNAQEIAGKLDDQAEKLGQKDGTVGDYADKAHSILDRIDTDPDTVSPRHPA
jgi:hypothetical protein